MKDVFDTSIFLQDVNEVITESGYYNYIMFFEELRILYEIIDKLKGNIIIEEK